MSQNDFPFSFLVAAVALPSSSRFAVVVVVLVVEFVVVVICIARATLLQNAYRHITVCVREYTASSSNCV